jgi:LacI family transcriptional regulator
MASVHHVTLRQIAAAAQVHPSTVSLALRGDARLRHATRQRIRQLADQMGYTSDAVTRSLANYRSAPKPVRPRIAWITDYPTPNDSKELKTAQQSFLGAQECADALGYELHRISIKGPKMTPARVTQSLRKRNTMGFLIAPGAKPNRRLQLPWQDFPAVAIGLSLASPSLHSTANHHYRSAKLAMQQLISRGYKRIGLILLARANDRVEQGWLGGYLVMAKDACDAGRVPPLILHRWDTKLIRRWYTRHRPDAIVTRHLELQAVFAQLRVPVPGKLGLAFLSVPDRSGAVAGIDENARAIGAGAMAMVADMITRSEKGIPRTPQRLLFEGTWIEGRTVRPVSSARKSRAAVLPSKQPTR